MLVYFYFSIKYEVPGLKFCMKRLSSFSALKLDKLQMLEKYEKKCLKHCLCYFIEGNIKTMPFPSRKKRHMLGLIK